MGRGAAVGGLGGEKHDFWRADYEAVPGVDHLRPVAVYPVQLGGAMRLWVHGRHV